ncbi:hypothetical protein RJT34_12423 [Clitoria ternatea]|uniref:Uncharacterized protein n=1 Tax=Clitoria ternatea TaxID=43366 RepID=A0AAN9JNR1_CLITE
MPINVTSETLLLHSFTIFLLYEIRIRFNATSLFRSGSFGNCASLETLGFTGNSVNGMCQMRILKVKVHEEGCLKVKMERSLDNLWVRDKIDYALVRELMICANHVKHDE